MVLLTSRKATKTPDRIMFKMRLDFGPYSPTFHAGLILERDPATPWPKDLEPYFANGSIERLPFDAVITAGQRFGKVGADDFALWFKQPPAPVGPEQWTREDVCRRLDWTDEQFERAQAFGFPARVGYRCRPDALGNVRARKFLFNAADVEAWLAQVRSLLR
jgi:hypothetical protein